MRRLIQGFGAILAPAAWRFYRALEYPQIAQERVQQTIGDRLLRSQYGKALGIRSIRDWDQIPIVDYDDIQDWIGPDLSPEPILFYEKTSGSRGAAKQIPYTRSLRRSFNHMFCVWAYDLIRNGPEFSTGKLYFCISPPIAEGQSHVQNDSNYLDSWLRWLLRPFWVQPEGISQMHDITTFKHALCLTLLQEETLEIISIWSPSFLTVHLDYIQTHQYRLRDQVQGVISAERYHLLGEPDIPWPQLWPSLKLISCWDSVTAADSANQVRSRFPGVLVQGKGLLATEAPMTVPLIAAQGCVPMLDQVFFEFDDGQGAIHRLHELVPDQEYEVIVSQKGGLYRYRMGDRVRVSHYYKYTPCLEFLGRSQSTSDLVGEKLHEGFVGNLLKTLGPTLGLSKSGFKSLVPVMAATPYYLLLLDQAKASSGAIAPLLDQALCQSYHYRYARQLGQLAPARVLISPQIRDLLTQYHLQSGKTWGDLKYPVLDPRGIPISVQEQLEGIC